jgi:hypothetical protein
MIDFRVCSSTVKLYRRNAADGIKNVERKEPRRAALPLVKSSGSGKVLEKVIESLKEISYVAHGQTKLSPYP